MAQATIVYWRDIPAQVIVKAGRKSAKIQLSGRFEQAIDRAAMRSGACDTDSYLADWRRGDPQPCGNDLDTEARRIADALEATYDKETVRALVDNGGRSTDSAA